ncbi:MAG: 5-(carboxyamino)imidazole ribonucleotide synthase [Candidatus Thermoplasmatota archaeon]|nr:5-(carboxyamino)imidazole ribonucleotide synthase [Candidatus Thermoplasmatota archaeon]
MRIGIIGSGQLGWMLIQEGAKFSHEFAVLDTYPGPASNLCNAFYMPGNFQEFVDSCDIVTYEFENGDMQAMLESDRQGKLFPGMLPVKLKKSRIEEKEFLRKNGIPVADFESANSFSEAIERSGKFEKSVIKTSAEGYDGKGQFVRKRGDPPAGGDEERDYIIEEFVDFRHEASIIIARGRDGETMAFPPSRNRHLHGMLLSTEAPCEDDGMTEIAATLAEKLDYTGVLGVEFFVTDNGPIVNEFAPRVHNSGHNTLSGYHVSQFEQHIRAITGMPLGDTKNLECTGIVNIIGEALTDVQASEILKIKGTKLYDYGKEPRKRRKIGHVNLTVENAEVLSAGIGEVMRIVYGGKEEELLSP